MRNIADKGMARIPMNFISLPDVEWQLAECCGHLSRASEAHDHGEYCNASYGLAKVIQSVRSYPISQPESLIHHGPTYPPNGMNFSLLLGLTEGYSILFQYPSLSVNYMLCGWKNWSRSSRMLANLRETDKQLFLPRIISSIHCLPPEPQAGTNIVQRTRNALSCTWTFPVRTLLGNEKSSIVATCTGL